MKHKQTLNTNHYPHIQTHTHKQTRMLDN